MEPQTPLSPIPAEKETFPRKQSSWMELLKFAFFVLIIVTPIRMFVAQPFVVSGASMEPTFFTGQYLIIDELSYHFSSPQRDDVIVLEDPRTKDRYLIKRVIGLPGETVEISGGNVCVHTDVKAPCVPVPEPYIEYPKTDDTLMRTLGPDEYFFMGDNRAASLDSRYLGPATRDEIIGRVFLRLLPPQKLALFPGSL